jgi:prepilin-type N-terminal cleavage/methylation domain-containing protein/prepilin-type processing-associated H-X9-DG protein
MPYRKISGFTLLELLVVVAILGIIAAILFPVFSRARENGRRAACQSNLKQIALGLRLYVGDFDSHFPQALLTNSSAHGWADAIEPYTKSTQILQCPSETTPASPDPTHIGLDAGYTDYAYNANLGRHNEADLVAAVSTIMACEGTSFASQAPQDGDDTGATVDCEGDSTTPNAMLGILKTIQPGQIYHSDVTRHLEGGNYTFADGHVKWLPPNKIHNWCTAPNSNATFAYK